MKVLIVTPDYPPQHGGIQLLVHRVATHLGDAETRVVAPAAPGAAEFDRGAHLKVRRVRTPPGGNPARVAALNAAALREALRFRPDVVVSGHIVTSPAAAAISTAMGVPFAQYVYASEVHDRRRLARFAVRRAAAVIAISAHTASLARDLGADPARMHVIHPGVDLPEPAPNGAMRTPTILTIARIEERYKGHDVMIRALPVVASQVPDVEWVVIGDGPLRPHLQDLAEATGVAGAVRWLGRVDDAERDGWLRRAGVFAMPSRLGAGGSGGEGFGIACMEASAHGVPVVAGDAGGTTDSVVDGETGLLVDANDHLAVATAVSGLLQDPARAGEMGSAGARRAVEFAWPEVGLRVRRVLEELVAGRSR